MLFFPAMLQPFLAQGLILRNVDEVLRVMTTFQHVPVQVVPDSDDAFQTAKSLTWFMAWRCLEPEPKLPRHLVSLSKFDNGQLQCLLQHVCHDRSTCHLKNYELSSELLLEESDFFRRSFHRTLNGKFNWGPHRLGQLHALMEDSEALLALCHVGRRDAASGCRPWRLQSGTFRVP